MQSYIQDLKDNMIDSLKAIGTSTGTIILNVWNLVPETLGLILIIMNIIYIWLKIKRLPKQEGICLERRKVLLNGQQ